ncbi:hypothetical protein MRB53_029009 [Persea americana]|uniref:Uncharacterized protein n=1 Tax=Persea americana TaxID=3435 RepID=A0ACC2KH46_PERAE|nr:hypothetical protein MRB53_029009 [Persea americana]|eukprot:TRINITY_DN52967_c0_g1_i1.p1 TRINITY_DN52967_c0_g1~~TRINITY_DN52967_c0_g1_i1.p1  ORF type:complete len:130 (+),score=27.19 TRINITY_DN52967_c0_g1_i1:157-546(+)
MATTLAGLILSTTNVVAKADTSRPQNTLKFLKVTCPWKTSYQSHRMQVRMASTSSTPEKIAEKVEESIKKAEEACAGDPQTGECAAAWDEVEEVSAAASHARERQKESDPLENYCKDNPETDECKTYDN